MDIILPTYLKLLRLRIGSYLRYEERIGGLGGIEREISYLRY
jgi:hypothetical protein